MKKLLRQKFTRLLQLSAFSTLLLPSISHSIVISDLYITEIMANPQAVNDSYGEWFELFNPTNETFYFDDITLSDNDSNSHVINNSSLSIQSGEYFVFGRNEDITINGGYVLDYEYDRFVLGNIDDEIILSDLFGNSLSLEYLSGFIPNGNSLELVSLDMNTINYTPTTDFTYGAGDFGTPGSAGSYEFTVTAVPEPPSLILLLSGIAFMRFKTRNRK